MSPTGLSIRGTVRDASGKPLPMAWVSTWLPEETTSWVTDVYYDGTYVRGMVSGTHDVRASADCHVSESKQDVTLPPSRTGIDFSLTPRDQLISGVVSDTNGIPLCDAEVGATPAGSGTSVTDYTERNGRYALQVPTGTYTVRASKSGYGPAADRAVTVPPYARGTDFILPAPNNTIQGIVRDNHGAAVEGATVLASNGDGSVSAASGADGGYAIQVFDGSWTVTASKAGYVTFTAPQPVSVPPDRSGVNFMLVAQGDVRRTYLPLVVRGS
jgi:protocatechuate 3,4-dioxygenase beta subunit